MAGHRNKDVDFVPWVGDRTGELYFIPRVLPPFCVPVPCFLLLAARLSDTPLGMLQIGKELQRNTQGTIVIRNLQSEVAIYRLDEFIDIDNFRLSNALILTHAMPVHAFVCVKVAPHYGPCMGRRITFSVGLQYNVFICIH
ncbi:hypothetical protein PVAP13_9NG839378 [Panicum virgatum]|uniref:Uncharacterized protein n=1 Tax=Panicum virgatum TaxID=38727 RepID=A0A8T0N2P9_PANVG|nr:hypothetical protein PVAP13_9NG839378 [Panicum virgatum]